jgi:hypothetical protein
MTGLPTHVDIRDVSLRDGLPSSLLRVGDRKLGA